MNGYFQTLCNKLEGVDPSDIVIFADYDLTLVEKHPDDFHHAPLLAEHHAGLARLSSAIGHFTVLTARGERSALEYLREHGDIHNLSLASNSGHRWLPKVAADSSVDPIHVPIPGYTDDQLAEVVESINFMVYDLKRQYDHITADPRELCGAVIYRFVGDSSSEELRDFHETAAGLKKNLSSDVSDRIIFDSKEILIPAHNGTPSTAVGYIDFKPKGMDKGITTKELFQHVASDIAAPFIIAIGDSGPDYEMMRAAKTLVGRDRMLGISVGSGLVKCDKDQLLDIVITPGRRSPVLRLHSLLEKII